MYTRPRRRVALGVRTTSERRRRYGDGTIDLILYGEPARGEVRIADPNDIHFVYDDYGSIICSGCHHALAEHDYRGRCQRTDYDPDTLASADCQCGWT